MLQALVQWLADSEQADLRRAFTVWLNRVFLPKRLPGVAFESLADLHEVHNMLTNRVESWTEQWKREGLEQGLERGLEQGYQATRHLLTRQARHRFGPRVATQAEPFLTTIADPVQLADLGDCPPLLPRRHRLAACLT